jgi:protein required for attachment to host cells
MGKTKLLHGMWVLVADGEKALFLRNKGDHDYPHLEVVRLIAEDNPPSREQGSDRPGRFRDGPNVHRSAVEETDWHRIEKERFAEEIAERLYRLAHRGDFDRILIVAPPLVLGEIRKHLHKEVVERIAGEIPKTLTNHPVDKIERLLQAA